MTIVSTPAVATAALASTVAVASVNVATVPAMTTLSADSVSIPAVTTTTAASESATLLASSESVPLPSVVTSTAASSSGPTSCPEESNGAVAVKQVAILSGATAATASASTLAATLESINDVNDMDSSKGNDHPIVSPVEDGGDARHNVPFNHQHIAATSSADDYDGRQQINEIMTDVDHLTDTFDELFAKIATIRRYNFPIGCLANAIAREHLSDSQCSKISKIAALLSKIRSYFLLHPACDVDAGKDLWSNHAGQALVPFIDCDPRIAGACESNSCGEIESRDSYNARDYSSQQKLERKYNLISEYLVLEVNRSEKLELEKKELEEETVKLGDEKIEFLSQLKHEQKKNEKLRRKLQQQEEQLRDLQKKVQERRSLQQQSASLVRHNEMILNQHEGGLTAEDDEDEEDEEEFEDVENITKQPLSSNQQGKVKTGSSSSSSFSSSTVQKAMKDDDPMNYVDRYVRKKFDGKPFFGLVVSYDKDMQFFQIVYEDSDYEDMSFKELLETLWNQLVPNERKELCRRHAETVKKIPAVWNRPPVPTNQSSKSTTQNTSNKNKESNNKQSTGHQKNKDLKKKKRNEVEKNVDSLNKESQNLQKTKSGALDTLLDSTFILDSIIDPSIMKVNNNRKRKSDAYASDDSSVSGTKLKKVADIFNKCKKPTAVRNLMKAECSYNHLDNIHSASSSNLTSAENSDDVQLPPDSEASNKTGRLKRKLSPDAMKQSEDSAIIIDSGDEISHYALKSKSNKVVEDLTKKERARSSIIIDDDDDDGRIGSKNNHKSAPIIEILTDEEESA